jgi:sporulation protein YlmC with PRC-barrel domain
MKLVRDLLDKSVVDRHGHELGRVDSIVLEMRPGAPPRVAAIELGPAVLAHRVWPPLGRWMKGLEVALGMAEERPLRVPFAAIVDIDRHVKVER